MGRSSLRIAERRKINKRLAVERTTIPTRPNIFYGTPWAYERKNGFPNIGKAYNEFVETLPDDSYVALMDGDCMFTTPFWGRQVESIVVNHMSPFKEDTGSVELIGAMTNRLGGLHQCHNGEFSNDHDLTNHTVIGGELAEEHWDRVDKFHPTKGLKVETDTGSVHGNGVAGFFLLFSKETWRVVGGFAEGTIKADTEFNKAVRNIGGTIGLARGLYLYHAYRPHETVHRKAWKRISHLRNNGAPAASKK